MRLHVYRCPQWVYLVPASFRDSFERIIAPMDCHHLGPLEFRSMASELTMDQFGALMSAAWIRIEPAEAQLLPAVARLLPRTGTPVHSAPSA